MSAQVLPVDARPKASRVARAETTLQNLINTSDSETASQQESQESQAAVAEVESTAPAQEKTKAPRKYKREPTENFFAWMQTIPRELWGRIDLYIWKQDLKDKLPAGQPRYIAKLHQAIDEDYIKTHYVPKYGDGIYEVQLSSRTPYVATDSTKIDIAQDPETAAMAAGANAAGVHPPGVIPGFSKAIESTAEMLKDGARAAVEISRANQLEQSKPVDIAGIVTAIASLLPQKDDSFLITFLENQRKESESRAERDRQAAQERAERDQRFFQLMMDMSEKRAAERADMMKSQLEMQGRFFEAMMQKEKERADSLGQFTGLIKGFLEVREKIEDSFSGGRGQGWEGVISTAIDRAGDLLPAIASLRAGQPMPSMPAQATSTPQAAAMQPETNLFPEMVMRIARYLGRDPSMWRGPYVIELIEEEYGGLHQELFINQQKEVILEAFRSVPPGKAILDHELGAKFLNDVIDCIKNPELIEVLFAEPEEEEPVNPHQQRPNGKSKGARS